ncbi:MAG: indole-3-glycerol-phosphate synthase TrpC, partial [Acidobacteriota bacterium]
ALIGVNNRDLRTFRVSLDVSSVLAEKLRGRQDVLAVAESGIRTGEDVRRLSAAGYRGFLIGEHLMRAPSPGEALARLLSDAGGGKGRAA